MITMLFIITGKFISQYFIDPVLLNLFFKVKKMLVNDFPNVNEAISSNSNMFKEMQVGSTELQ